MGYNTWQLWTLDLHKLKTIGHNLLVVHVTEQLIDMWLMTSLLKSIFPFFAPC